MRFKQHYNHPASNKIHAIDINVFFEEARDPSGTTPYVKSTLVAAIENLHYVSIDVEDLVFQLLDTRRTSCKRGLVQTYLEKPYQNSLELTVNTTNGFSIGDPVAIKASYKDKAEYNLITNLTSNSITLQSPLKNTYWRGAFVQNLTNRDWGYPLPDGAIGATASVQRPGSIGFNARARDGKIHILIQEQINIGTTVCYDVYVREQPYKYIEPHWIPDLEDVTLKNTEISVSTHGGGELSGGGQLQVGQRYYLSIVTKDGFGRTNVNESPIVVEPILIN